jgi:3-oxoacyl-[acyl-carrier-protein] synthase-1
MILRSMNNIPSDNRFCCLFVNQWRLVYMFFASSASSDDRLYSMIGSFVTEKLPIIEYRHYLELASNYSPDRIGVVLGSSTSGIGAAEQAYIERALNGTFPSSYHYRQQELASVSELVALFSQAKGPCYTVSTACSSSAKVFKVAKRLLEQGVCDLVICGGIDSLCRLTVQGFNALELLSETRSNPFSLNRKGLNLGEGGCLALLQRSPDGIQVLAVGEASDAYHISTPHPDGLGAVLAIKAALNQANLDAASVKYINLHGTGTKHNDAMESLAVSKTFGREVPCSSTKPLTGHLLGAAGATELAFCYLLLNQASTNKPLIPHIFDGVRDPELAALRLAGLSEGIEISVGQAVLSNSFAFGGSNAAVLLGLQ